LGRFFFALIFLVAAPNHFTRQTIAFSASQGVLWPQSWFAFWCAGYRRRPQHFAGLSRKNFGAWLLVLFLIPVTLMLHKFWTVTIHDGADPNDSLHENVSMLGGALLISQFGAGPFSLDARRSR